MNGPGLSEDCCRCGHVASAHADGDGNCATCRADARSNWTPSARCHRFMWAERWQLVRRSA